MTSLEKSEIATSIKEIGFFLEGLNKGQGDILPLGKKHLEDLWKGVKLINKL